MHDRSLTACAIGAAALIASLGAQAGKCEEPATQQSAGQTDGDIIVTARFRPERVQDVPAAITAITRPRLIQANIVQLAQVQFEAPNLNISIANPRMTNVAIRGLGNNPVTDGLSASVGVYVDGVYLDRPGMGTFDLVDLEQIEILRGPQGTLFGRNTSAGAIRISTREPSSTSELEVIGDIGNLNSRRLRLSASGPGHPTSRCG